MIDFRTFLAKYEVKCYLETNTSNNIANNILKK